MGANGLNEYWVPEHVKDYLRKIGFALPLDDMEPWIRSWNNWMSVCARAGRNHCHSLSSTPSHWLLRGPAPCFA